MKLPDINLLMRLHFDLQTTSNEFTILSEKLWEVIVDKKPVERKDLLQLLLLIERIKDQANGLARVSEVISDKEES